MLPRDRQRTDGVVDGARDNAAFWKRQRQRAGPHRADVAVYRAHDPCGQIAVA